MRYTCRSNGNGKIPVEGSLFEVQCCEIAVASIEPTNEEFYDGNITGRRFTTATAGFLEFSIVSAYDISVFPVAAILVKPLTITRTMSSSKTESECTVYESSFGGFDTTPFTRPRPGLELFWIAMCETLQSCAGGDSITPTVERTGFVYQPWQNHELTEKRSTAKVRHSFTVFWSNLYYESYMNP
ncbi:hypothetical protein GYMLUDRAFT_63853 [Collybiopsis luxurians FD-317 M1]|uniref:Uncharacterized protein n=1 Tax=Collybiopsis luxurians FD-317 M1 TaxID=944289 RepID=A0A0D0BEZ0_9AGAR|nr:hypothetical protein GYMLUDRAFT_63853 [Collybiopsis luxurians FD-317 M1]